MMGENKGNRFTQYVILLPQKTWVRNPDALED